MSLRWLGEATGQCSGQMPPLLSRPTIARIVGGICVVMASIYFTLLLIDKFDRPAGPETKAAVETESSGPCGIGNRVPLQRPFVRVSAFAVAAELPAVRHVADSTENNSRSTLVVCEDGKELSPAHSAHADIGKNGPGSIFPLDGESDVFCIR
jgi:hypothetical protein